MSGESDFGAAGSPAVPPSSVAERKAGGWAVLALLGAALGWYVLLGIGAALGALAITGVLTKVGWVASERSREVVVWVGLPLQQVLMMLVAVRRVRRRGIGGARSGLGWLPVRRRRLVAGLAGGVFLIDAVKVALCLMLPDVDSFMTQIKQDIGGPIPGDAGYVAWNLAVVVAGAPLAEELFFRGWLWGGLRRHWGVWRTGLMTGLLFLAFHGTYGDWRLLVVLVPMVVLMTLARHFGGSVRASLAVHVANNALATAGDMADRWLG